MLQSHPKVFSKGNLETDTVISKKLQSRTYWILVTVYTTFTGTRLHERSKYRGSCIKNINNYTRLITRWAMLIGISFPFLFPRIQFSYMSYLLSHFLNSYSLQQAAARPFYCVTSQKVEVSPDLTNLALSSAFSLCNRSTSAFSTALSCRKLSTSPSRVLCSP